VNIVNNAIRILAHSISFFLLFSTLAYAEIGGAGSTCDPSTPHWGTCTIQKNPFQKKIKNTVKIPAGNYEKPFVADQNYTEYVLQGNMTSNGTAIIVDGSFVSVNLNGYSITYNETNGGCGVYLGKSYGKHHVSIRNGSIIQGAANSKADQYGKGNNPITSADPSLGNASINHTHISNLYIRISSQNNCGLQLWWSTNALIEQCTIEDTYGFGEISNRHQGVDSIKTANDSVVRNCTVINSKHRGINMGYGSSAYGNRVQTRSIATNAAGICNAKYIYNNTIITRGEHSIGIMLSNSKQNMKYYVYNNYMNSKTTHLGAEYGSSYYENPNSTLTGNNAVGFRNTWNGKNIYLYNNEIYVESDSNYKGYFSPTGETAYINARAKGLMIGPNAGDKAFYYNNTVTAVDKDGSGEAIAVALSHNFSDALHIENNTLTSNICCVSVGDSYGQCSGSPLLKNNTLIRQGNFKNFKAIACFYPARDAKARFVDNRYLNGTIEDSMSFKAESEGTIEIYFGKEFNDKIIYSSLYHDAKNSSSVLLKETYDPPITLPYASPATDSSQLCSEYLFLCEDKPGCTASGGYWYAGVCNANPAEALPGGK